MKRFVQGDTDDARGHACSQPLMFFLAEGDQQRLHLLGKSRIPQSLAYRKVKCAAASRRRRTSKPSGLSRNLTVLGGHWLFLSRRRRLRIQ